MRWLRVTLLAFLVLSDGLAGDLTGVARVYTDQAAAVEGEQPLYIVREIIETTSDGGAEVDWVEGPAVVARYRLLEGADSKNLWYDPVGLSVRMGKEDERRVVLEVESLALAEGEVARASVSRGGPAGIRG